MLRTFKAVLKGNYLEWLEDAPLQGDRPVNVHVIIVSSESSKDLHESSKRRLEALEKLAANNAFALCRSSRMAARGAPRSTTSG
ncbi:MAG: hypothetical protein AB4352_19125 [Hormoscilla sp.]